MKTINLIFLILLLVLPMSTYGQSNQAPLSPKFVQQKDKTGYVYSPYEITYSKKTRRGGVNLPAQYDLRDVEGVNYMPAVRDQNPYGTCWVFSTYASVESIWKKTGDSAFIDLSEAHLAKCHGFDSEINDGGNEKMSTAYFARLAGPVYELVDPYSTIGTTGCISVDKATDIPAYVDEVYWLGDNRDLIKQMIMEHGAVATHMYAEVGTNTFASEYYNSLDFTYFYNGSESRNHGVAIVGWDDSLVVTGGTAGTPSQPGAWIVRNSWGTDVSDSGYFYASYEDNQLGQEVEVYYGKTSVTDVDTLFDYAELGAITAYRDGDADYHVSYAAVKYTASQEYLITHVGTFILSEGLIVDLTICESFDGEVFRDTLAHKSDFYLPYSGFQKLEMPVLIDSGDFYLIARYESPNSEYPLPVEVVVDDYCSPQLEEGKQWLSGEGLFWEAAGLNTDHEGDLAIKAFAREVDSIQPYFSTNAANVCISQSVTFENNSIGAIDSFVWHIADTQYVTLGVNEQVIHTFTSGGSQSVILKAYKDSIEYSFERENIVEVLTHITPHITVVNADDYYSKGKPITLVASGASSYKWYADAYLDGESGRSVTFSPDVDSLWIVLHASMGDCFEVDSVLIRMVEVPYDDIEDALELVVDETVYGVSNEYASIQEGEPIPEIGSCNSQSTWCEEGGLHNSIWFKFIAPSGGKVTINSTGFDNQLALYDATATGTWNDIMSGDTNKYDILAANDDFYDEDYAAKIEEVSGLTVGKTYWMQMDGSGGGATGEIDIIVSSTPVAMNETEREAYQVINYPDLFHLTGSDLLGTQVTIINSMGINVYSATLSSTYLSYNGDAMQEGVYFISLKLKDQYRVCKVAISDQWMMVLQQR